MCGIPLQNLCPPTRKPGSGAPATMTESTAIRATSSSVITPTCGSWGHREQESQFAGTVSASGRRFDVQMDVQNSGRNTVIIVLLHHFALTTGVLYSPSPRSALKY